MAPVGGWDESVANNLEVDFATIRSVLLALKDLLSAAGRFARESQKRGLRSLSTAPTV